jgi:hypothetical protein
MEKRVDDTWKKLANAACRKGDIPCLRRILKNGPERIHWIVCKLHGYPCENQELLSFFVLTEPTCVQHVVSMMKGHLLKNVEFLIWLVKMDTLSLTSHPTCAETVIYNCDPLLLKQKKFCDMLIELDPGCVGVFPVRK